MKKAVQILCLLLAAALLTACGAQESGKETGGEILPLTEKVKNAIPDMDELAELTAEDLNDLLGVEAEECREFVFLQSDGTDGREVLAIRARDENAAEKISGMAENYLERRRNETRNYIPELYQLLGGMKVQSRNLTVVLVVGQNAAEETDAILAGE